MIFSESIDRRLSERHQIFARFYNTFNDDFGKRIFEILKNNIENKNYAERCSMQQKLVVRSSTREAFKKFKKFSGKVLTKE